MQFHNKLVKQYQKLKYASVDTEMNTAYVEAKSAS